jgi:hypothetical protein
MGLVMVTLVVMVVGGDDGDDYDVWWICKKKCRNTTSHSLSSKEFG